MCKPEEKLVKYENESKEDGRNIKAVAFFLIPLLFFGVTNILPIYANAIIRVVSIHAVLYLHYTYFDKDNYSEKLSQKQLHREKNDYLVGIILHMYAQLVLQILFPGMFFIESKWISTCAWNTILVHVLIVEPLYYFVHRWLHVPQQMKAMHGFHHLSVNPIPSTSLVQNFKEHFIYIATFGPAMLLPYFLAGKQHWIIIGAYLVLFDLSNAYGHTNIRIRHWLFENAWSPLRYLIYTPEFHLGHHAYYNYNFGLFMPLWDHLFQTYREYKKNDPATLPHSQQDFVFIGHNGGLGHLLTIPEISIYNIYDSYKRTFLPIELELLLAHIVIQMSKLFQNEYTVSRYSIINKYIGRIICILRSPLDYTKPSSYPAINNDILNLIKTQHQSHGTTCFGLGNLNKMKQLNDGGSLITTLIQKDEYLKDKNIRIWTGDTLTTASVYHQILQIPKLMKLYYIGGNGKIGIAVIKMLVQKGISVCLYSKYESFTHPLVTYSHSLSDLLDYQYILIGKYIKIQEYHKILKKFTFASPKYFLDYTVPFMPISNYPLLHHLQIGLLQVTDNSFLKGYYDICMGTEQGWIHPCHAGCIINMVSGKPTDETGEINLEEINPLWEKAKKIGLKNKEIHYN